jgi:hypothetical protein
MGIRAIEKKNYAVLRHVVSEKSNRSTAVIGTELYTSCPTNFSEVVDVTLTVSVRFSANSDVIFWLTEQRCENHTWILTCTLFI